MSEPGVTVGRLMAAERNALAAIDLARAIKAENDELRAKVIRMEALLVQYSNRIDQAFQLAVAAQTAALNPPGD